MSDAARDPRPPAGGSRSRWLFGGLVVLALVAAGVVWYLGRDTPAAVDTQAAIEAANAGGAAEDAEPDANAGGADDDAEPDATVGLGDLSGTYRVDPDAVAYDLAAGTGTFVGFRIDEELATVGATTAVGRTPQVDGTVVVDGTELVDAVVTADLTALRTDIAQRDNRVQGALDTATNPTTTFELTEPVDLGELPPVGEPVSVMAVGELTLHGVTRPVTVPLDAVVLSGVSALLVTGSFEVELADYGIVAPSAPIVVSVADTGTVELQLYLAPA